MNMTLKNRLYHAVPALVALAALLLYVRAVGYEYVWDDLTYLRWNSQYMGLAGAIRSFTEPFYLYSSYYRPLAMLSFVVPGGPPVQHGINVALHAVNTVLVLYVARALMPQEVGESKAGQWAAALGALLFAVHPVAVESTVWVSGRFDTLMCTLVLGTCVAALGGELTRKRLILVFALFACAMGSKESALGLPVAIPFLLLLKWRLEGKEAVQIKAQMGVLMRVLAALALAVALYTAARLVVVQALFADKATFAGGSVLDKLNVASLAVAAFVKLIVAPLSHSAPLHPFKYETGSGLLTNTLVVVACVLALLAAVGLKKPKLNFPLALLAALAMSWPVLHLIGIPNGENIISDRYALVPLALLLAGLAAVAGAWGARRVPEFGASGQRIPLYAAAGCLLWAGALAAYSNATIPLWRDRVVFWSFAYKQAPDSMIAHMGYVRILMLQKRWDEAKAEMDTFGERHPGAILDAMDLINVAMILEKTGNHEEARELFQTLEEHMERRDVPARNKSELYGIRAGLEVEAGNWEQAAHYLEKAVQFAPTNRHAALQYARALFMTGQTERADEVFERTLVGVSPDTVERARRWRADWKRE